MTEEPESWPGFRPHPDDAAFCYVCGQVRGNHGDAPDVHCPPVGEIEDFGAALEHLERQRGQVRAGSTVDLDGVPADAAAELAEPLDLLVVVLRHRAHRARPPQHGELAVVVKAYPHPGIADQAFALCTEEVVSLLYDRGRREELTADGWRFLLMYAIADRMKGAQTGTLISAALLALGGLGKAEIPGKER